MKIQSCLLFVYRLMVACYPPSFRKRFAPEMLELAALAEATEWPLIFGDTSVAIVRCWLQGSHSTAALPEPNAYVPLRESPISAFVLLPGLQARTSITEFAWPRLVPSMCTDRVEAS